MSETKVATGRNKMRGIKRERAEPGRISFNASREAAEVVGYLDEGPKRRMEEILARYGAIIRERRAGVLQQFDPGEMSVVAEIVAARGMGSSVDAMGQKLARMIADSPQIVKRWGGDTEELMSKVGELETEDVIVLMEMVTQETYWKTRGEE